MEPLGPTPLLPPEALTRWTDETLRLNERYLVEVVEPFGLCPWARAAREQGQVDRRVLLHTEPVLDPALDWLTRWAEQPHVAIGLLIFPRLALDRSAFQRFVNHLISEDSRRYERESPPFALAAFHPEVLLDLATPERLVPWLRKSPDPTIQVVRISELARVRGEESAGTQYMDPKRLELVLSATPKPTLRERIAQHNFETVRARGPAIEAALAAIEQDHVRTRRALEAATPDGEGARSA